MAAAAESGKEAEGSGSEGEAAEQEALEEGAERREEEEEEEPEEPGGGRKRVVPGIVYLGHLPPRFRPLHVRNLLSAYGEVGRVFFQPEGEFGALGPRLCKDLDLAPRWRGAAS